MTKKITAQLRQSLCLTMDGLLMYGRMLLTTGNQMAPIAVVFDNETDALSYRGATITIEPAELEKSEGDKFKEEVCATSALHAIKLLTAQVARLTDKVAELKKI